MSTENAVSVNVSIERDHTIENMWRWTVTFINPNNLSIYQLGTSWGTGQDRDLCFLTGPHANSNSNNPAVFKSELYMRREGEISVSANILVDGNHSISGGPVYYPKD